MSIGIEAVWNFEQVDRVIERLEALGRDGTPLMKQIGLELVQAARRRLGGEVAPNGTPWKELNPGYREWRSQMFPAATGMLKVRGNLSRSLTYLAGPVSVTVGSPLIYAGVHQAGATIDAKGKPLRFRLWGEQGEFLAHVQRVRIPARPYLGIGQIERLGIEQAWQRHMRRLFDA